MTHVAFLRAVNVGGKGLVKMADLQKAFTAAGAKNVRTVIASGNVIFDAPAALGPLRDRILKRVGALLGAEPVIVFRTLPYLARLIESAPFGALVNDKPIKLYVLFLAGKPKRQSAFPIAIPKEAIEVPGMFEQDALVVSRRKPNGMYGFPGLWTDKEIGVASTARNWNTVVRIAERPT
jgi:uncharacterized protein (DUF1697 family)